MPWAENTTVTFTCSVGGTSNPDSHIVWRLDEEDMTDEATEINSPGDYNARSVKSVLVLTVTRGMNGRKLHCDIMYGNSEVADEDMTLDVKCE